MNNDEFEKIVAHGSELRSGVDARFLPLAFGGVASVWVLKQVAVSPPTLVPLDLALFAAALTLDFGEVLVSWLVYRDPHALRRLLGAPKVPWHCQPFVAKKGDNPSTVVHIPLARWLFSAKIALLVAGYVLLVILVLKQL